MLLPVPSKKKRPALSAGKRLYIDRLQEHREQYRRALVMQLLFSQLERRCPQGEVGLGSDKNLASAYSKLPPSVQSGRGFN